MWSRPATIIDCGVDWFTTTALDDATSTLLLLKADNIRYHEESLGFHIKPWRMAGYSGWRCGRLEFGERADGAIVRVSSALAALEWWGLYQITGRCSRIDLQATLRCENAPEAEVLTAWSRATAGYEGRKDGPKITMWSDNNQGATLYLGKRSSELYFRAYNKFAQSGDEYYENCVRVELEIKGDLTKSAIANLLTGSTVQEQLLSQLANYMDNHLIPTKCVLTNLRSYYERPKIVNDDTQLLRWIEKQVKPTVQKLLERGLDNEVMDVLGLTEIVRYCARCRDSM